MPIRTTQERWEKLILHRDLIIQEANLKGAEIPLNSDYPEIILGLQRITLGLPESEVEALLDEILGETIVGDYSVKGQAVLDEKEAIRQAIIAKDVAVPAETPLSQFPAKIASIEGGTCGTIPVYFIDTANGKIISEQLVVKGEDAALPAVPMHQHLTFTGWKGLYQNVTEERWIATTYDVDENATIINITINRTSLLSVTMNIWKSDTAAPVVIEWESGVFEEVNGSGNLSLTHLYTNLGSRAVKITSTEPYALGHSLSAKSLFDSSDGAFNYIVESIYFPAQATLKQYSVNGCRVLKGLVLSNGIATVPGSFIMDCPAFEYYLVPDSVTSFAAGSAYNTGLVAYFPPDSVRDLYGLLAGNTVRYVLFPTALTSTRDFFKGARQIKKVRLPIGVGSFATEAFKDAYSVELIDAPSTVSGLSSRDAFKNCVSLKALIFRKSTGVVTASEAAFNLFPQTTLIYVPDDLVDAYKTYPYGAWPIIAEQVRPISQLPPEYL